MIPPDAIRPSHARGLGLRLIPLLLALSAPALAAESNPHARAGFFYGSDFLRFGFVDLKNEDVGGVGLGAMYHAGMFVNPRFGTGLELDVWTDSRTSATSYAGMLAARYYPRGSGFELRVGIGGGAASWGYRGRRHSSLAAALGVGYEFRARPDISIGPRLDFVTLQSADYGISFVSLSVVVNGFVLKTRGESTN